MKSPKWFLKQVSFYGRGPLVFRPTWFYSSGNCCWTTFVRTLAQDLSYMVKPPRGMLPSQHSPWDPWATMTQASTARQGPVQGKREVQPPPSGLKVHRAVHQHHQGATDECQGHRRDFHRRIRSWSPWSSWFTWRHHAQAVNRKKSICHSLSCLAV